MNKIFIISIIALCFVAGHIQNDIITPSFPDIITYFETNPKIFHLASSCNFIAIALAGVIIGPLSDYFNRRIILISGLAILIIGIVGIIYSSSIEEFIFWRFIQGIGIAAPITVTVILIFDFFNKKQASQLISINDGIITAAKSSAPILGGYINFYLGWQANFYVLLVVVIISLIVIFYFLPDVREDRVINHNLKLIFVNYIDLCKSIPFVVSAVILGLMACSLSVYITTIPIIFINSFNIDKVIFGYYQSAIMGTFAIVSFANALIIGYFGYNKAKQLGCVLSALGACLLILLAIFFPNPNYITLSMMMCSGGFAILIATFMADSMNIMPKLKGYASSFIAFTRLVLISTMVAIAGIFYNSTILPVAIIIFNLVLLMLVLNYFLMKNYRQNFHE